MNDESRLRKVQDIKDMCFFIQDQILFNPGISAKDKYLTVIDYIDGVINKLNELSYDYITNLLNCIQIIVTKDVEVESGRVTEVPTNITLVPDCIEGEVYFNGYAPSNGYLSFYTQKNIEGMKIFAQNDAPVISNNLDVYMTDNKNITFKKPGTYKILAGTTIGIMIVKKIDLSRKLAK